MYRILEKEGELKERRNIKASALHQTGAVGHRTQPAMVLGHYEIERAGEVDLFLPVRHSRCLQPLCCRLDGRLP